MTSQTVNPAKMSHACSVLVVSETEENLTGKVLHANRKGSEQTLHMNIVMWLDRLHPTQSKLIDHFIGIQVMVQTTNQEHFL